VYFKGLFTLEFSRERQFSSVFSCAVNKDLQSSDTIRYDTTCYFNVRPKADKSSFIYRVEQTTKKWNTEKVESKKTDMLRSIGKQSGESVSSVLKKTRSSAIAEGRRDASCQLKSCQLPRNSAETTYSTSPDQIDGMKLEI